MEQTIQLQRSVNDIKTVAKLGAWAGPEHVDFNGPLIAHPGDPVYRGPMSNRPPRVNTETHAITTGCGKMYVTLSQRDELYKELCIQIGKNGGCAACFVECIGSLVSEALNGSPKVDDLLKHFKGVRCPSDSEINPSCVVAIGRGLEQAWGSPEKGAK